MKISELIPKVEGIEIAVLLEDEGAEYSVFLRNGKEDIIEGIIITSVGYGEDPSTGEKIRTSTLRHSLEVMLPKEIAKIELIVPEVFGLYNEYWVSFWINDTMYDKKFVFVPESISEKNMKIIPLLGEKGVMII